MYEPFLSNRKSGSDLISTHALWFRLNLYRFGWFTHLRPTGFSSSLLQCWVLLFIFGHSLLSFCNHSGLTTKVYFQLTDQDLLLLCTNQRGFSSVETGCHCVGSVYICTSPIQLATNDRKSLHFPKSNKAHACCRSKTAFLSYLTPALLDRLG